MTSEKIANFYLELLKIGTNYKLKNIKMNYSIKIIKSCLFLSLILPIISCNWIKDKSKETINKSGEIVSKSGSEFVNGISEGIEKSFQNKINISQKLQESGLKNGVVKINQNDSTFSNNILSIYFIFEKDLNQNVTLKLINSENLEYGRITENIEGKAGESKYIDFTFEPRIVIEDKGEIIIE